MNKLLVICGPTATGKTKLALHLAKIFNGVVISADSRQVYKDMDIGTGKGREKVLGYDLVNPDEQFSVSSYVTFAKNTIKKIYEQKKLPILVGGTGLYIRGVVDGIETVGIPPDINLRKKLSIKTKDELFKMLLIIDPQKAESMNESDRNNPRRLIRAIEIAKSLSVDLSLKKRQKYDTLFLGLSAPRKFLNKKIEKRVDERIKDDFEKEIEFLKNKGFWEGIPQVTLGYKDWPDINKWQQEEFNYAKRQIVWFKKDKRINWFDITKVNYKKEVENLVQKWYIC